MCDFGRARQQLLEGERPRSNRETSFVPVTELGGVEFARRNSYKLPNSRWARHGRFQPWDLSIVSLLPSPARKAYRAASHCHG
jgi:hypothetical protein